MDEAMTTRSKLSTRYNVRFAFLDCVASTTQFSAENGHTRVGAPDDVLDRTHDGLQLYRTVCPEVVTCEGGVVRAAGAVS